MGVSPDFIVCRSDHEVSKDIRTKIALFCDVHAEDVFSNTDCDSIYDVVDLMKDQGFDVAVCKRLGLELGTSDMSEWNAFIERYRNTEGEVNIAVVGKYVSLPDAYISIIEALGHAGVSLGVQANIHLIDGENLDPQDVDSKLKDMDGILVPGGFGVRGLEGKIAAAQYAREHKIPYFGICLGMQVAGCEFARHKAGMLGANSTEFMEDLEYPVIDLMSDQENVTDMGGTMRLGAYPCKLLPGSLAHEAYGEDVIYERHRHRYEVNNAHRQALIDAGLIISGISPNDRLVEMVELPREEHPWFVASQAHPEFKSRPTKPHPLFVHFVKAAQELRNGR